MSNIDEQRLCNYFDLKERISLVEQNSIIIKEMISDLKSSNKEMKEEMKEIRDLFHKINNRLWSNFIWTISGFAGLLYVMAHGFKWI